VYTLALVFWWFAFSLVGFLAWLLAVLDFGGWYLLDLCLGLRFLTLLIGLSLSLAGVCLLPTCMSRDPSTESGTVDLSVTLPCGLRVSITGPASSSGLAASLLRHVAAFDPDQSAPSEFELVSSAPTSPVAASSRLSRLETRDQVRRSLQPCPPSLFVLVRKGSGHQGLDLWPVGSSSTSSTNWQSRPDTAN